MLNNLKAPKGAVKKSRRVGRGESSGAGKCAGKGDKGQNARSGVSYKPGFEGGQMPLHRRIPKRGFTNKFRVEYAIVNLGQIAGAFSAGEVADRAALKERGLLKSAAPFKVLGDGELSAAVTVRADKFSKSAVDKITAAGGKAEVV
jgi:large subunit ribosomal protein L15